MMWQDSNDDSRVDDRELPDPSDMDQGDDEDAPDGTAPCPKCGRFIYDDSVFCPHCGYAPGASFWNRKSVWIVFGAIVCLLIVAWFWVL